MVAAQRRRRSLDDLIDNTQGDGMVAGIGSVNGDLFDEATAQTMVMSYDYMVLAGTQGLQNHRKKDRLFKLPSTTNYPRCCLLKAGAGDQVTPTPWAVPDWTAGLSLSLQNSPG